MTEIATNPSFACLNHLTGRCDDSPQPWPLGLIGAQAPVIAGRVVDVEIRPGTMTATAPV